MGRDGRYSMIDLRLPTGFPTTSTRALFSHLNHASSPLPLPSLPPPSGPSPAVNRVAELLSKVL